MRRKKPSLIFIILIILSGSFLGYKLVQSNEKNEDIPDDPRDKYAIFPVKLPTDLEFAGEKVPVDQLDVIEALDREILVNTYWQSQTLLFIKRANRYFPVIEEILQKHNIPDDFKYLAIAESGLMNVVSPANAVGYWQILKGTGQEYGLEINKEIDERYNLEKSTEAACKYLQTSYDKYQSWTMAAASYNAGRRGVDRQISKQDEKDYFDLLFSEETARYLYRILAYKMILSNPSEYGFYLAEGDLYPPIPYFEVTIDGPVSSFAEFAKKYHITYKTLKQLNPWLRDNQLDNPSNKSYFVKIPRKGFFDPTRVDLMPEVQN